MYKFYVMFPPETWLSQSLEQSKFISANPVKKEILVFEKLLETGARTFISAHPLFASFCLLSPYHFSLLNPLPPRTPGGCDSWGIPRCP